MLEAVDRVPKAGGESAAASTTWSGAAIDFPEGDACGTPDAARTVMNWLQKEVSDRLLQIDQKLDVLVVRASTSNHVGRYVQYSNEGLRYQGQAPIDRTGFRSRDMVQDHLASPRSPQHYAREYKADPLPMPAASSLSATEPPVEVPLYSSEQANTETDISQAPSLNLQEKVSMSNSVCLAGMHSLSSYDPLENYKASIDAKGSSGEEGSGIPGAAMQSERRGNVFGHLILSESGTASGRSRSGRTALASIFSAEPEEMMYSWGGENYAFRVLQFLENPRSSPAAQVYAKMISFIILSSCLFNLFMTIRPPPLQGDGYVFVEAVFDLVFLMEIAIRWTVAKKKSTFFLLPNNVIDVIGSLPPLVARIVTSDLVLPPTNTRDDVRYLLLCLVPLFRLLKLLRRWEKFQLLLTSAFILVVDILPVLMVMLWLLALSFATVIYFVERGDDNIQSLPEALWMTIVTMTTVGYGDAVPKSPAGYLVTMLLVICSALYMAVPIGIVGNSFSYVWQHRDLLLVKQQARNRLLDRGFTARDIPELFKAFGSRDGQLSLQDFQRMITDMGFGVPEDRVLSLFTFFDTDENGAISAQEFVRGIFPESYITMYRMGDASPIDGVSLASSTPSIYSIRNSRVSNAGRPSVKSLKSLSTLGALPEES